MFYKFIPNIVKTVFFNWTQFDTRYAYADTVKHWKSNFQCNAEQIFDITEKHRMCLPWQ